MGIIRHKILTFFVLILFLSCSKQNIKNSVKVDKDIKIDPDYTNVTVPYNIAPLNFKIGEEGDFVVKFSSRRGKSFIVKSSDSKISIPIKKWKSLLSENKGKDLVISVFKENKAEWISYNDIHNKISESKIDSYLVYRILYPGYELWNEMGIYQRNLETFKQKAIIENKSLKNSCVNCHSFANNSPENMMFHIRGKCGGTVVSRNNQLKKLNIKTKNMLGGAVYPYWHPSGKYISFSTNKIKQVFHSTGKKYIEVSDYNSDLIMYDVEENRVFTSPSISVNEDMETFPTWSPDGKTLYYTSAPNSVKITDRKQIRYNLMKVSFDEESKTFGKPEIVYNAVSNNMSVAFPRISPNGKYLVFTMAEYGNFTIWHSEADLYIMDLRSNNVEKMKSNSNDVESYHSWASNSRWMVFSSKRRDGQSAHPFFTYIDENGHSSKPFILPQKDPDFYDNFLKTFNIPELVKNKISIKENNIIERAHKNSFVVK